MSTTNGAGKTDRLTREELRAWLDRRPPPKVVVLPSPVSTPESPPQENVGDLAGVDGAGHEHQPVFVRVTEGRARVYGCECGAEWVVAP